MAPMSSSSCRTPSPRPSQPRLPRVRAPTLLALPRRRSLVRLRRRMTVERLQRQPLATLRHLPLSMLVLMRLHRRALPRPQALPLLPRRLRPPHSRLRAPRPVLCVQPARALVSNSTRQLLEAQLGLVEPPATRSQRRVRLCLRRLPLQRRSRLHPRTRIAPVSVGAAWCFQRLLRQVRRSFVRCRLRSARLSGSLGP